MTKLTSFHSFSYSTAPLYTRMRSGQADSMERTARNAPIMRTNSWQKVWQFYLDGKPSSANHLQLKPREFFVFLKPFAIKLVKIVWAGLFSLPTTCLLTYEPYIIVYNRPIATDRASKANNMHSSTPLPRLTNNYYAVTSDFLSL